MRIRTTGALARLALALIFLAGWMQPASSRDRERDASDEVECKGCVESKDIERGAVEGSDIGKDEVEEEDVREGAITTVEIRDGEVKTPDLADGAVTSEKIGDGEVTTDDIADGTVTTTDIADGTVTNADLGQGSVDTGTIEDETITTADIKNGSISADDLAFDAVTQAELDGRMGFPGSGPVVVDAADQLPIGEAIGVDGLPLIAYSNGGSMYVVHCKTAACDLHDQPVATGGSSFGGVTVAVPGDGRPVVAGDDLWRCADEVCSSFDQVFVGGQISSLVIDVDGLPLFLAGGTLTKCDDPACSTMTTGDNFGNESAVTIGADGSIFVAYDDGDIEIIRCLDLNCSGSTATTVESGAGGGGGPRLVVGTDGSPVVAYVSGSNLRMAHCGNLTCSAVDAPITVDSDPSLAAGSMAVGRDGMVMLQYTASSGLHVAHCLGMTCAAASTIGVDANGVPGTLATGASGFPTLAYVRPDTSGNELVVSPCTNPFCVPNFRRP